MRKLCLVAIALLTCLHGNAAFADLGFERLIVNSPGRCWTILNRDFYSEDVELRLSYKVKEVVYSETGAVTVCTFSLQPRWKCTRNRIYNSFARRLVAEICKDASPAQQDLVTHCGCGTYTCSSRYTSSCGSCDTIACCDFPAGLTAVVRVVYVAHPAVAMKRLIRLVGYQLDLAS